MLAPAVKPLLCLRASGGIFLFNHFARKKVSIHAPAWVETSYPPQKKAPGVGGLMFRVDRGGLVKFALAVQNKKHGEDDNSGNHNIVVRAHFFPPLEG